MPSNKPTYDIIVKGNNLRLTDGYLGMTNLTLIKSNDGYILVDVGHTVNRQGLIRGLKERGLTLSTDKTRITPINEGFDFLGQNLRKYDGKPLVKPSKKNTHAFLEKVRGIIDANKSVSQTVLIGLLNPVIRGWANYHQHGAAKETFDRVDHEIWRALWQWARRRHLKKSRDWVKKHYFPALRNRAWTFATKTGQRTPEGQPIWTRLVYAGETKIRRRLKVRQDANPFDPQWKLYFQERAFHARFGIHRHEAGIKSS